MSDREAFAAEYDVPRGTMAAFDRYAALLGEWQARLNLVGPATLPQVWQRHFADSAQLLPLAGRGQSWLDIGAGAGFPSLVVALLDPAARVTAVESIAKKCAFLQAVVAGTGLDSRVAIVNSRVEAMRPQRFDVITARACAGLGLLFEWGLRFAGPTTRWILPKGVRVDEELALARDRFRFDYELVPSRTEPAARIVVATGVVATGVRRL